MAGAPGGEIVVYAALDGEAQVDVRLDHETVWLTQLQMAELFGRERSVVTKHIRTAFQEGELDPEAVCAKFAHTESSANSSVSKIFLKCLVTTVLFTPNNAAIAFCDNQKVPFSK